MFHRVKFQVLYIPSLTMIYLLFFISFQSVYGIDDSTKTSMHHKGIKSMMHDMHDDMMKMEMTGNPDVDFAKMMIRHHEGAIKMSDNVLKNGRDREIKSMAKNIKDIQGNEIKELKAFAKKGNESDQTNKDMTGEKKKDKEAMQQSTGSMEKDMMKPMNDMVGKADEMKMTGDADKDYAAMMIIHHNAAINMAEEYLDKGKDEKLKSMAKKMIQDNKSDIDKFEDWQSKH